MKSIELIELLFALLDELGQRTLGEDLERFVPYAQEGAPDTAGFFVAAFLAGLIIIKGNAGKHGNSAVHKPYDVHQVHVVGFFIEVVAPALALFAVEDLCVPKLEEDGFEKFLGYTFMLGYLLYVNRAVLVSFCEINQGMDGVFTFFRKHICVIA